MTQERLGQWTKFGPNASLCNKLSLDSHLLSETQCRHNVCIVHRNNAIFGTLVRGKRGKKEAKEEKLVYVEF